MAALTLTLTDDAGLTDTGQRQVLAGVITDRAGITDTGIGKGLDGVTTDDTGLTDSGTSRSVAEVITDRALQDDTPIRSGTASVPSNYTITLNERITATGSSDDIAIVGGSAPPPPPPPGPGPGQFIPTGIPRVRVEVAFALAQVGANAFILDDPVAGLLDSTYVLASGLVWTDISPWLKTFSLNRPSQRIAGPVYRYEAGTCSLELLNDDRRFDPLNLLGPYVNSSGVSQVRPMRPIRLTAVWQTQEYPLFSGFVDSWLDAGVSPVTSVTSVTATDGFKVLANDRGEPSTIVGSGERTDQRIHRILNGIGWPNGSRDVAVGDISVQGTTLAGDALAELQLVADTEAGDLYISPEGVVTFRNRRAYSTDPASATSQVTFGRWQRFGELPYSDVAREYDDSTMINQALIARVDGIEQRDGDEASISEYQLHSYARQDLLFDGDDDALIYAKFLVSANKVPEYRFTSLTLDPRADPQTLFPQALGRRIGDRITVRRRPPGAGVIDSGVSSQHHGTPVSPYFTVIAADAAKWEPGDQALVYEADDTTLLTDAADLFTVTGLGDPFVGYVNVFVDRPILGIAEGMIVHKMLEDRIERECFIRGISHTLDDNHRWTTVFALQGAAAFQGGGGGGPDPDPDPGGGGGQAGYLVLDSTTNGYLDLNLLAPGSTQTVPTLTAQAVASNGQVDFIWTLTGATATSFTVGRDGTDTTGFGAYVTTDPATATHRIFDKLINGTPYTFTVTATLTDGGTLTATIVAVPGTVTTPTVTVATTAGSTYVDLSWSMAGLPTGVSVTQWVAARDGTDSTGFGAYTTGPLPAAQTSLRFDKLLNTQTYTFTVTATLSTGVTVTGSKQASPSGVVTPPGGGGGGGTWTTGAKSGLLFNSIVFNSNGVTQAKQFGTMRGRPVDGLMWFTTRDSWASLGSGWGADKAQFLADGHILVSTMPHAPTSEGSGMNAAGAANAYATQQQSWASARAAGGFNHPLHVIRIDWECNGTWYEWSASNGGAATLKSAIQNFVTNVRIGGLDQVKFDLCFNKGPSQAGADFSIDPGAAYIDIIAVDAYDHFADVHSDGEWNTEINRSPGLQTVRNAAVSSSRMWGHDEGGNVHSADGGNDNPFYYTKLWGFINDSNNRPSCAYHVTYDNAGAPSSLHHEFTNLQGGFATIAGWNPSSWDTYADVSKWGGL